MLNLASKMLRHRMGSAIATLVALSAGVMILMSMGVLVESGLRFTPTPQRYAAADVIVAHHDLTVTGKDIGGDTYHSTVELPEGGTVPAALVDQIRAVPGVATVQATALPLHPGRVDAIGITAAPGADRAAMVSAIGRLANTAGAKAYAGADRGQAEPSDNATAASLLVQVGAAFGGYVVMLIVFVVAGTVGLSVRHRRRDLALLRAIAATPGQVRKMIVAEAGLLSLIAAAIGLPAGIFAAQWVHGELTARGFIPAGFPIVPGVLAAVAAALVTTLVAMGAALLAARRITAIHPTEALGEAAVEPGRNGKVRLISGLVTLAGGVSASALTVGTGGQAALSAAVGMLYLFVIAVGLLAPWINRWAARALAPLLGRVWGASGFLATANLRANAQGMATVVAALVLSVGFGGSVWFLQDNLERQTVTQSSDGILADRALVSPAGLPDSAAADARKLAGVTAVTAVRHTSVVLKVMDSAEPVQAQAIDPDGNAATMNLKVREGSLADLRGASVAVSGVQASSQHWKVGDQADLWLGDGTPAKLRVVAIYDRGLGFGDITLTRDTVAGHTRKNLDDQLLIRMNGSAAGLSTLAAHYPGSTVVNADNLSGQLAKDLAISAWLNKLLIGVMVGFAALAAANTMVMAALARSRELALLRLVGVTPRQVKRMVNAEQFGLLGVALTIGGVIAALTLTAVVNTLTGHPTPYVPAWGWAGVIGGTTLLALVSTVWPIARLLRTPPIENIGVKE